MLREFSRVPTIDRTQLLNICIVFLTPLRLDSPNALNARLPLLLKLCQLRSQLDVVLPFYELQLLEVAVQSGIFLLVGLAHAIEQGLLVRVLLSLLPIHIYLNTH